MQILVVCHTQGCGNANISIPLTVPDDCGHVICGACMTVVAEKADMLRVGASH